MAAARRRTPKDHPELGLFTQLEKPAEPPPLPDLKPPAAPVRPLGPVEQMTLFNMDVREPAAGKLEINRASVEALGADVAAGDGMLLLRHPLLEEFEYRRYQVDIASEAAAHNTLVIAPTGLGKTRIAVLAAAKTMQDNPGKKILILAPTKPLAEQHALEFGGLFKGKKTGVYTGESAPEGREKTWSESDIVSATPQTVLNDVRSGRISLRDVSLMVVDEVHRATKDYPYVDLAGAFDGRLIGLTASPGSGAGRIESVCRALKVEAKHIEIRTRDDDDVAPYVQYTKRNLVTVKREEAGEVERLIGDAYRASLVNLRRQLKDPELRDFRRGSEAARKLLETPLQDVKQMGLLAVGADLDAAITRAGGRYTDEKGELLKAKSLEAEAMKLGHAVKVLPGYGIYTTREYIRELGGDGSKASMRIMKDKRVRDAIKLMDGLLSENRPTPKLEKAAELAKGQEGRVIVFAEYRDTVDQIVDHLRGRGVEAEKFIGQGEGGMTQTAQKDTLERFKRGEFKALVSTSIGEEGLDVPEVAAVIFFEPVADERRLIQREGRTGRHKPGNTYILLAEGSRDEATYWTGYWKWRKMRENIELLRKAEGFHVQ